MKIKTKLTLSIGMLFVFILAISLISTKYVYELKWDSENILVANYNSLEFSRNILRSLEREGDTSLQIFESNLKNQESNITEIGEKQATQNVRDFFTKYKLNRYDSSLTRKIREEIYLIMEMNMSAIQRKSELAKETANQAVFAIAISGTLCFLISFVLLINLPSNVANPIQELTESIKQIAAKNYSERVNFEGHDEFGQLAKSFNSMAEKLEEYNESNMAKLMLEKRRTETIINNMHDPVFGLDENMKLIFANEEAIKISGLRKDELEGKNVIELALHNDLIRTLAKDIVPERQDEVQIKTPIKIYTQNKESHFEKEIYQIYITPTGEQQQKLAGHVIFLRNVTSYKELDSAKTNFIATVSHEFKTPISSIKMSLQLLQNQKIGALNEEQQNLIQSIQDDANRLLNTTSELLNITQVESGNLQINLTQEDPSTLLTQVIQTSKAQADLKQIKFQFNRPPFVSKVLIDFEKTKWVLNNIITNAIRHSYENSIISLTLTEIGNKVEIAVKDTGPGIAPQYLSKIFDRYFKVPGNNKEGTGLGLAISREFIEAQGGKITVESDYGSGSIFTINFNKVLN